MLPKAVEFQATAQEVIAIRTVFHHEEDSENDDPIQVLYFPHYDL
jgi:hypothetical protein